MDTAGDATLEETASSPGNNGIGRTLLPKSIVNRRHWKRTPSESRSIDSTAGGSELIDGLVPVSPASSHGRRRQLLSRRGSSTRDSDADNSGLDASAGDDQQPRGRMPDTYGSDDYDILPAAKPPFSSHPSQIGYLTTSSPLVQAEHFQGLRNPLDSQDDNRLSSDLENTSLDLIASQTTPTVPGLALPSFKNNRSVSPAGRLRSVFKSKKSPEASLASNDSYSPERPRTTENGEPSGGGGSRSKTSNPPASSIRATSFPTVVVQPPGVASVSPAPAQGPSSSQTVRRLSRGQRLDTAPRPETPPASGPGTPVIVNTPPTPTDSSHPSNFPNDRANPVSPSSSQPGAPGNANVNAPTSTTSMIAQRRPRAGSASLVPSKLSNYTLAPLSPTPENGPNTTSTNGFFSSVFSAAQNATNSLSHTITNTTISTPWTTNNKKSSVKDGDENLNLVDEDDVDQRNSSPDRGVEVESTLNPPFSSASSTGLAEPAVKTLGMGDLSLSHLGISEQPKTLHGQSTDSIAASASNNSAVYTDPALPSPMPVQSRASESLSESRHRSESAPADASQSHSVAESVDFGSERVPTTIATGYGQPQSVSDTVNHDGRTTPSTSVYGDRTDPVQRTASIRSALERRRNRGSSAATGGTIAAAIIAANASLAHPTSLTGTPKLTGFAIASKKRNRDFHSFFKSVPDDDYLIEDYSCALQREILAHGRLYVSEGHLCFSSNILGWVTTLVMSFDEIVSVEKRSTALVFKNGLMISTLHAKHIFASFASRDSTYDLIVKIWKLGHPSLQSSLNGVHIDETGGDKTEKIEAGDEDDATNGSHSDSESDDVSDDDSAEIYDEDAEENDLHDAGYAPEQSGASDSPTEKSLTRKASGTAPAPATNGISAEKPVKDFPAVQAGSESFPGPTTHAPTECGDAAAHYDKILADEVVHAPLGKVFSFMFGAASVSFISKWLTTEQKCFDLQMADKKGLGVDNKTRTYSYIKPLFGSIGPKQTRCIVTELVEAIDFDKAVNIVCSSQTPDVPSGNIFTVKTRYCLSWAENNSTRVQMNCTIEWSGKSWLRVAIEKGANEGQAQYARELFVSLKEALSARSRSGTTSNGTAGKAGKKKSRKGKMQQVSGPAGDADSLSKKHASVHSDWGVFEPLHGVLGPVVDIIKPILTGNVMYGLLVGLLVALWYNVNYGGGGRLGLARGFGREVEGSHYWTYPGRLAAYEEMWRREESELWEWLEERVGLDRLMSAGGSGLRDTSSGDHGARTVRQTPRKRVLDPRTVDEKLREEQADDRDVREAIRVTEEKLRVLKEVVDRREKAGSRSSD